MSTKGSWQRPFDDKKWADNFERIFGKKAKTFTVTVPDALPSVVSGFPGAQGAEPLSDSYRLHEDEQGERLMQALEQLPGLPDDLPEAQEEESDDHAT